MSGRFGMRATLAGLAAAAALQLSCAATLAAQGVALDTGRITVGTPLVGGRSYQLARISVRNPGTQRTTYDLVVTPVRTDAQSPLSSWITFSPKQVTVRPGKQQVVTVSIRLPKSAAAGPYEVLVGARVAPAENGMSMAAAAAARLTFTVAGTGPTEAIVSVLPSWWPAPAIGIIGVGLLLGRHRFRLRLPIERR